MVARRAVSRLQRFTKWRVGLFIFDLQENRLEQVTNDLYTQIQPKWSPDGRSIVLVTDQFSTTLESLAFGNYRLGVYDVAAGTVRPVAGFDDAKNINPQWAPDSRSLYFLGDPNGIPNIFRLSLASADITPGDQPPHRRDRDDRNESGARCRLTYRTPRVHAVHRWAL